jgi:two-component system OmpR family response regulator
MRLLVVDDDPGICALIVAVFRRFNYSVEAAFNGEDAIRKIRSTHYSAVVLDLMLPRMNGFEVLRELRSFTPELLSRTVVVTAAADSTLKHFDRTQVFKVIRKPFDLFELVSTVKECALGPSGPVSEPRRTPTRPTEAK